MFNFFRKKKQQPKKQETFDLTISVPTYFVDNEFYEVTLDNYGAEKWQIFEFRDLPPIVPEQYSDVFMISLKKNDVSYQHVLKILANKYSISPSYSFEVQHTPNAHLMWKLFGSFSAQWMPEQFEEITPDTLFVRRQLKMFIIGMKLHIDTGAYKLDAMYTLLDPNLKQEEMLFWARNLFNSVGQFVPITPSEALDMAIHKLALTPSISANYERFRANWAWLDLQTEIEHVSFVTSYEKGLITLNTKNAIDQMVTGTRPITIAHIASLDRLLIFSDWIYSIDTTTLDYEVGKQFKITDGSRLIVEYPGIWGAVLEILQEQGIIEQSNVKVDYLNEHSTDQYKVYKISGDMWDIIAVTGNIMFGYDKKMFLQYSNTENGLQRAREEGLNDELANIIATLADENPYTPIYLYNMPAIGGLGNELLDNLKHSADIAAKFVPPEMETNMLHL